MATYKAIGQTTAGDASVLKIVELPRPKPGPKDLLIKILSTSSNPTDYKHREGFQGGDAPLVVGWDAAGIVEEVGSEVSGFAVGDEVFWAGDRTRPGCNAELELVDYRIVGFKPKSLSFEDAAALPLCAITSWEGLVEHMGIPVSSVPNPRSLLIINGAGGVGSIAIQLARNVLKLERVVATASRPESSEWCKQCGATDVINHKEPLKPQLEAIGLKTIDYAFVCYDPDLFMDELAQVIAPLGKMNFILPWFAMSASTMMTLFFKSVGLSLEIMYAKSMFAVEDKIATQGEILQAVSKYVDEGVLKTTATERMTFTLENVRLAQDKIKSMGVIGKIVLKMPEGGLKEK
ncbi:zinc-binding alcohol dehydrogenase family protein [Hyaloraphidium curvatum]|nr:zinc-binding alcohol dehydrogenase family protein [Hyaloraphidium curvatum]